MSIGCFSIFDFPCCNKKGNEKNRFWEDYTVFKEYVYFHRWNFILVINHPDAL